MSNSDNSPATKKDLKDFDVKIEGKLAEMEARLVELIRDSQTEILRGFEKFQTANTIRMRKMEANHSNLDTSSSLRLDNLEERVLEIEKKLIRGQH